ncbi:MAG: hypothetical protein KH616_21245, partial [Burkholderia sp.]|nr:hypothetical protein [Burkholderia sp.]
LSSSGRRLRRKCWPMCCTPASRIAASSSTSAKRPACAEAMALQRLVRIVGEVEMDEAYGLSRAAARLQRRQR